MIKIIKSDERYISKQGWVTSRFSFPFAEYYDDENKPFGALQVFNDDLVKPEKGFGLHRHRNMEIVSYVIEGELQHEDNQDNGGVLRSGEIQIMGAGTGIYHSEYNHSYESSLRFLQLWFIPDTDGLEPRWEQKGFKDHDKLNQLLAVVTPDGSNGSLKIIADVTIYLSKLESNRSVSHHQKANRRMYLFVIKGNLTLNQQHPMAEGDTARITETTDLEVTTKDGVEFMLIDLA